MDEAIAIEKAKAGDKDSFRYLVEIYEKQAFATAFFLTHHFYTAQDVVQEAFVQCYFHLKELREPAQFRWWFYRILTRISWQKKYQDKKIYPVAEILEDKESTWQQYLKESHLTLEKDTLLFYMDQLEEKHRTVLILYYFNGFSVKEIARILGCMEGTIKSRLYYGRKRLRALLSSAENTDKCNDTNTQHKEVSS